MNSISQYNNTVNGQSWVLGVLALMMAITRFHHEGSAFVLPDASLAIFFLAGGFFLKRPRVFLMLLTLAVAIDYLAVTALGVSDYCFSPAYAFLLPTYAVMWFGGRWPQRLPRQSLAHDALLLAVSLVCSASLAFVISNGSFYWFSGKVAAVGILEYAFGLAGEYPPYLGATAFYVLLGLAADALLRPLANVFPNKVDGH
jgi:hypothetical protein